MTTTGQLDALIQLEDQALVLARKAHRLGVSIEDVIARHKYEDAMLAERDAAREMGLPWPTPEVSL